LVGNDVCGDGGYFGFGGFLVGACVDDDSDKELLRLGSWVSVKWKYSSTCCDL
jgi:hypothetical protein